MPRDTKELPVVCILEEDDGEPAEGCLVEPHRNPLEKTAREEGRPETRDIGEEGNAEPLRRDRPENVVLDRVAQDHVGPDLGEDPAQPEEKVQVGGGVQALHAHLQMPHAAADRGKPLNGVILGREHRHLVAIRDEGLDDGPSEIPDVPGCIDAHEDFHVGVGGRGLEGPNRPVAASANLWLAGFADIFV